MEELAIVGTFYDGYYDIWEDFLELFFSNWPECPYKIYIVNDEKELNFSKKYNVTVFHAGKNAEYSQRVQTALKSIKSKYYLLLLEDFFIGEKLDKTVLEDTIRFIKYNNVKYYRMPMNEFTPKSKKGKILPILPTNEYTLSCQPSIWEKDFLQRCIGDKIFNAWIFEGIYAKAPLAHTEDFLEGCLVDYTNKLSLYHGAVQGQFVPATYKHFKKKGYKFKTKMTTMGMAQDIRIKFKHILFTITPLWLKKIIKKLKKTDSVLDKYSEQISNLITEMGLE